MVRFTTLFLGSNCISCAEVVEDVVLENRRFIRAGRREKHTKWEKAGGLVWTKVLIQKNTAWCSARIVRGKVGYPKTLTALMCAQDVEVAGLL
jgi:hypothetical protein